MSTEIQLPEGWAGAAIEDLFDILQDGKTLHQGWSPQCKKDPSPSERVWGVLKTTAIQDGEFFPEHNKELPSAIEPRPNLEVQTGDLLITCAGPRARCGIPCLVRSTRQRLLISGKMYRFRVPENSIDPAFVEAYLRTLTAQQLIDKMKTGGSESGLNMTHARFRPLPITVAPLNEQRRIVSKIEALESHRDAAQEALEAIPALLEKFRQSVLAAAFRGDLTREWRAQNPDVEPASVLLERIRAERKARFIEDAAETARAKAEAKARDAGKPWTQSDDQKALEQHRAKAEKKYKEPEPVDTTGLPELPEGWCWTSVAEFTNKVSDGVHKKPSYVDEGVPFVTVKNLTAGPGISFEHLNYITHSDHQEFIRRTHPEKGDVLISKDGTLGVVRYIDTDIVFSIFVSVALMKPVLLECGKHLALMLETPQIQGLLVATGSGLKHIHLKDLRATPVPLAPLAEQTAIQQLLASRLDQVGGFTELVLNWTPQLAQLSQSILAKAFRGELVPQDPNDEPASVLLERIREERAATAPVKKKRKSKK